MNFICITQWNLLSCYMSINLVVLYVHNELLMRHELSVYNQMQVHQPRHYWHVGPYLLEGRRSVHCGMFSSILTSIYNFLMPVATFFCSYDNEKYPQIPHWKKNQPWLGSADIMYLRSLRVLKQWNHFYKGVRSE